MKIILSIMCGHRIQVKFFYIYIIYINLYLIYVDICNIYVLHVHVYVAGMNLPASSLASELFQTKRSSAAPIIFNNINN